MAGIWPCSVVHCLVVVSLLLPNVLSLQCKTELNQPSDGWVLFRGTGLSYHYYDLSKSTSVEFPSLQISNNPLAKSVEAFLSDDTDYIAYTSDLSRGPSKTFQANPQSSHEATSTSSMLKEDTDYLAYISDLSRKSKEIVPFPDKNGIVSVSSQGNGLWLMYSNVFFPPLSGESIADPSTSEWNWLDVTPSQYAFYLCITIKEEDQLTAIMDLLASSQAYVHIRRISPSSIFNRFITIDSATPVKRLNDAGLFTINCDRSSPSAYDQNCYLSNTISEKISYFSRHRFITNGYHQFCFESTNTGKAVLRSKPFWPNFPGSPIPQSEIVAVTVQGARPMACFGDLFMMKDQPGKSSLVVCFEHQRLWQRLQLEGFEDIEHCLPHETNGNLTVLSSILPIDSPLLQAPHTIVDFRHRSVSRVLKDKGRLQDDLKAFGSVLDDFEDDTLSAMQNRVPMPPPPEEQQKRRSTRKNHKQIVTNVNDLRTFDKKVRYNDDPVLALFCYNWCSHCAKFRSQFRKIAKHPSLKNVTFVDVNLKMNHLPPAFDVPVSPTLRFKPESYGFNSQRVFGGYELAGYRTLEGKLNLKNVLHQILNARLFTTLEFKAEDFQKHLKTDNKHEKESVRPFINLSSNNSVLHQLVMGQKIRLKNENPDKSHSQLSIDVFTNLIKNLVDNSKSPTAKMDKLQATLQNLQKLKNYNSTRQWKENPLSKNVLKMKTYSRPPSRSQRGAFKIISSYLIKALQETSVEIKSMKAANKVELFSSLKNNLDNNFKLLLGKTTNNKSVKSVFKKAVQRMVHFIGLLKQEKMGLTVSCIK